MKRYALTDTLPAPDWKNRVVARDGYNSDIIKTLNSQFPKAVEQCRGVYFSGTTDIEKARAIYNYLRNGIKYKKDPKGRQLIQLPARMIVEATRDQKHGADCKSLSLAAAAFLHCQGFKNVRLRYASYDITDPTPTHVYAVASSANGTDIIVDPVYKQFNAEAPYKYKKDYQMEISVLSGPPTPSAIIQRVKASNLPYPEQLRRFQAKVRPGGFLFNVLSNEISRVEGKTGTMRYSPEQLGKYAKALRNAGTRIKSPFIQNVITKELAAVQSGNFSGSLYQFSGARKDIRGVEVEIGKISLKKFRKKLKKISLKNIVKGVKAVGLIVPRKSFLAMVSLNVRGLATRMNQLGAAERSALWKKFGGQPSVLEKAVRNGIKKRPLFGAGKKVKAIKGIGAVTDEGVGIAPLIIPAAAGGGVSAATVATIIAAAAPILVAVVAALKKKGIPEVVDQATAAIKENPDFPEAVQAAADKAGEFNTYVKQAAEVAQATGVIPEKPENTAEAAASKALPTDELETTGPDAAPAIPGGNTTLLLGAAAVGAFLLMKKK